MSRARTVAEPPEGLVSRDDFLSIEEESALPAEIEALALEEIRTRGVAALGLPARSAYVLGDEARRSWQHSVPPTPGLRYSITFRTLPRSG